MKSLDNNNLKKLLENKSNKINKNRVIFHVDVNNAFLSWTAIDLLEKGYKTDIRTIPSIIGGDETKRSGIVLAKSNSAKELGIKTAEPIYFALKKFPNIKIYSPNHILYEKKSEELNKLFYNYTEIIEKYSIDESFLDVTDYLFRKNTFRISKKIKKRYF